MASEMSSKYPIGRRISEDSVLYGCTCGEWFAVQLRRGGMNIPNTCPACKRPVVRARRKMVVCMRKRTVVRAFPISYYEISQWPAGVEPSDFVFSSQ